MRRLTLFTAVYVGLFALMIAGWYAAPSLTLMVFAATAIIHFSEDWGDLREPLFRFALGFAPLCAIGIGHPEQIETIFAAMADEDVAMLLRSVFVLIAPIVLLVAATGLFILAQENDWRRAGVFAIMLGSLIFFPTLVGFTLFFCIFHTPRHLIAIRQDLATWPVSRLVLTGAAITGLAVFLGAVCFPYAFDGGLASAAAGFQLLAALAMPHQCVGPVLQLCRADLDVDTA